MSDVIYFYSMNEVPYGVFSNFSSHPITIDGQEWPTSEHYFQAQKFAGHQEHVDAIRLAPSPGKAAREGRSRARPLRADWEQVKDDVMRDAVLAKVLQHEDVREVLMSTRDAELVEKTRGDYYWGCGTKGTGKNMLGIILMEVRATLQAQQGE